MILRELYYFDEDKPGEWKDIPLSSESDDNRKASDTRKPSLTLGDLRRANEIAARHRESKEDDLVNIRKIYKAPADTSAL